MKEVTLAATPRSAIGTGGARKIRVKGNIPCVVYGPETVPMSIEVSEQAFRSAVKEASGISAIFNLDVAGKTSKVLVRDIQRDPVTSKVVHVDFHAISMNKPIHLSVPIKFTGIAKGVKTDGGILQITMRDLDISCLPADIPEHIDIDVSELGIGESLHVRDLKVEKARILAEPQRTVVVIAAPTVVKSETAAAEEGEAVEGAEGAEGEAKAKAEGAPEKKEG